MPSTLFESKTLTRIFILMSKLIYVVIVIELSYLS